MSRDIFPWLRENIENRGLQRWQMHRFWNSRNCRISGGRQDDCTTCGAARRIRFGPAGGCGGPRGKFFSTGSTFLCAEFELSGVHNGETREAPTRRFIRTILRQEGTGLSIVCNFDFYFWWEWMSFAREFGRNIVLHCVELSFRNSLYKSSRIVCAFKNLIFS